MNKVYVVMGTTGEYSDRTEWPVCAYSDEQKAKEHVVLAEAYARTLFAGLRGFHDGNETSPYDPQFDMDYNGTSYHYLTVDVRDMIPGTTTSPTEGE